MVTVKLFLGSSLELTEDKKEFGSFLQKKEHDCHKQGLKFEYTTWEDFPSYITIRRTQDRYNEYIQSCDITVFLIHTHLGDYTREEFNVAYKTYKETNHHPRIYVYFKTIESEPKDIQLFKKELNSLKQFYNTYDSYENLFVKFNRELDKLISENYIPLRKNTISLTKILIYSLFILTIGILISYFWWNVNQPGMLTVKAFETQNHSLKFYGAEIELTYGDKTEISTLQHLNEEVIFKKIPAQYKGKPVHVKFISRGYNTVDTTFKLSETLNIPLKRDQRYGRIFGVILNTQGIPLNNVTVTVKDMITHSDSNGFFSLNIPIEQQQEEVTLIAYKKGYESWLLEAPPSNTIPWRIVLEKKKYHR